MGLVTDLAVNVHDVSESLKGLWSLLVAIAAVGIPAFAVVLRAFRKAQRHNEVEISRVREVALGASFEPIKPPREFENESAAAGFDVAFGEVVAGGDVTISEVRPGEESVGFRASDIGVGGKIRIREVQGDKTGNSGPISIPKISLRELRDACSVPSAEERIVAAMERRSEARFRIQTEHYANALRQSTTYFYLSIFAGIMGFILLVSGVGLALGGLVQVGTVTGVGGALVEGAAGLIFNQANKAKSDAQSNLASIALAQERDENRQMALIYSSRITDAVMRDSTNVELARKSLDAVGTKGEPPASPPGNIPLAD